MFIIAALTLTALPFLIGFVLPESLDYLCQQLRRTELRYRWLVSLIFIGLIGVAVFAKTGDVEMTNLISGWAIIGLIAGPVVRAIQMYRKRHSAA